MTEKEFFQGSVVLDVYDANTIMRNEMIGRYELNLKYVLFFLLHSFNAFVGLCTNNQDTKFIEDGLHLLIPLTSSREFRDISSFPFLL